MYKKALVSLTAAVLLAGCPGPVQNRCDGVACGEGRCVLDDGRAACLCNAGYTPQGLSCVPTATLDPCNPNPCASTGKPLCVNNGGLAVCQCASGRVEVNGQCVVKTACTPNPCTGRNQTKCIEALGQAQCLCDPGYAPDGTGCSAERVWDCDKKHTGTTEDTYEPNECPSLATAYNLGSPEQSHSISPAGDVDWLTLTPDENHIIEVQLTGSLVPLYLDAYGADGVTAIASDHRGVNDAALKFKAARTGQHYLRIKALRASDTSSYEVLLTDVGADDYPDTTAAALPVSAGATFSGKVQYADDVDVVKLPLLAGNAYGVTVGTTTVTGLVVDLLAPDGQSLIKTLDRASGRYLVRPPLAATYFLRARSSTGVLGTFTITTEDLGPDDHGDVPADATGITADGSVNNARFERSQDIDVFSFAAQQGRIYSFTCTPQGSVYCYLAVRDAAGTIVLQDNSGATGLVTFLAKATERMTIAAISSSATGDYTYKLEDLGQDDHGDAVGTATAITLGQAANGRIELPGDKDFFGFQAAIGKIYTVTCTVGTLSSCYVSLYGPSGTALYSNVSGQLTFRATTAGNHAVEVKASSTSYTGTYTLTVTDQGADDHGDTAATATALTLGSATPGSVQFAQDKDFFSFAAQVGRIYRVSCATSASYLCTLNVRDPNSTSVGSSSYGASTAVTFEAAASGTFTVEVGAYSSYTGAYTLTVTDQGADDHGDTTATATALTLGTAAAGNVETSYDKDFFSFAGAQNRIYRVSCATSASYLCTLNVRDPSGTSVGSSSYGSSTQVAFEAAATGTFTVEVGAYSSYAGAYTVTVTDLGADDHGDTPAAATALTLGTATAGNVETPGDRDVFSFSGTVNRIYQAACTSTASYQCTLTVRDAAGTTVASTSYGSSTQTSFEASATQTYSVEVRGYSSYTGTYALTVTDLGPDDHGDTAATATTITAGASATAGNIETAGDRDFFAFGATAGRVYQFSCSSTVYYSCVLTARDPSGTTLTSSSYGNSTQLAFKALASGTHSVEVRAYSTSYTGAYAVALVDAGADDHGDTAASATSLTLGTTANGNVQFSGDADWFAVTLTAGTLYTVTTTPGTTSNYFYTALYQADGTTQIGSPTTSGSRSYTPSVTGTFYVRISGYYSTTLGTYTLRVQ